MGEQFKTLIIASFFTLILFVYGQNKKYTVPEGKDKIPLGPEFCTDTDESPRSNATKCKNGTGATKSICFPKCMAPHTVQLGHSCDPYLFRFARRKWDSALVIKRQWMKGEILGTTFAKQDSDFSYKGMCTYFCPAMMCMGVIQHEDPTKDMQWVDMVLFDCVHDKVIDRHSGVCTCGHQWSTVDPLNAARMLDNTSLLVKYNRTIGLDRRLVFDKETKKCAAERYGHCSYQWDPDYDEFSTPCLSSASIECVNRTATHLGTAYRNFKTKKGVWYGICDSRVIIEDPFGGVGRPSAQYINIAIAMSILMIFIIHLLTSYDPKY